jgi:hypothetical protein
MADEVHDLEWERWSRLHPDQVDDVRSLLDGAWKMGKAYGLRESGLLGTSVLLQQQGVFIERLERVMGRLEDEDERGSPYWRTR